MIQKLKVEKLSGRFDYEFDSSHPDLFKDFRPGLFKDFHPDINLFIGHIGTGKTTLLNLIWFLTSGNLHRVISEIPFDFVSIQTSEFFLSIKHIANPIQVELTWSFTEAGEGSETLIDLKQGTSVFEEKVDELNKRIARAMGSSLFFPTFRRVERQLQKDLPRPRYAHFSTPLGDALSDLKDAFWFLADELSNELSVGDHKFVAAVSTYDVIKLLTKKHSEVSKGENLSNDEHETLVKRWTLLNQLVGEVFEYYDGIRITEDIILAADVSQTQAPIPSSKLSSGEKQLLGFLCYNAFSEARQIFIDEPELSLHPDWQRLFISLLQYQGTEKQIFLASHSPYIGVKYQDKEFRLERRT